MNHIAKWDGSIRSGLGNGLDETANNLAVDSRGNLYTDILVITADGMPETVIRRWDGSSWSTLGGDLSRLVDTLAEGRDSNIIINDLVVGSQDQLYAGGYFYLIQTEQYVGYVAQWDGSTWTLLGSGMNHTVYDLAVDGQDNLYAGGEFTVAGDTPANRIAKWDGSTWSALGSGLGGDAPTINDLAVDESGNLYVAGQFSTAGVPAQFIARWDGASWSALLSATGNGVNDRVFAVAVDGDGRVSAGGFSPAPAANRPIALPGGRALPGLPGVRGVAAE